MLYGELEGVINEFVGTDGVVSKSESPQVRAYSNYIEAALLLDQLQYADQGYAQLLKVIGRVTKLIGGQAVSSKERRAADVSCILRRFRECCQYLEMPLEDEDKVQRILWIMLRSHFEQLERHNTLPRFGVKSYVPDFGVPDLGTLVEVKFIGQRTKIGDIQEGILADIPGYLNDATGYSAVVVFVYDAAHKLRDARKFIGDLKSIEGVIDVIVVPGIG